MKLSEFRKLTRGTHPDSELVFFSEGLFDEDDKPLLPGIGVFDMEEHELVYLGDISVVSETDE